MNETELEFSSEDRAQRAVNGLCRYCSARRPAGYAVTCGGSHCQEAAYNDGRRARRKPRRPRQH